MKTALIFFYLGVLSLLSAGIFVAVPIIESCGHDPGSWVSSLILFGFAPLCGLLFVFIQPLSFTQPRGFILVLVHMAALLAILWIILWCFVWLASFEKMGDQAEMYIKHTAYLHLFGVGFTMAAYAKAWMTTVQEGRLAYFSMAVGWAVCYMAGFSLYLNSQTHFLWPMAVGGLLVVLWAFLVIRQLKRAVETAKPQA